MTITPQTLTGPNIFSSNALQTSGTTVANTSPINNALYNTNIPFGRIWINEATSQVFIYLGKGSWSPLSTGAASNQPLTWVTANSSQGLAVNNGYLVFGAASPVSLVLPLTSNIGDQLVILAATYAQSTPPGFPGFTITQNTGQQILAGPNAFTTLGAPGSLTSTTQGSSISLVCVVPNLTWNVLTPSISNFSFT